MHLLLAPEDAEVLVHRLARAGRGSATAAPLGAVEERLQLALGVASTDAGTSTVVFDERPLGRVTPDPLAVRDRLHERVAAEPVRAVHGDARHLAGGVQALE